MKEAKLVDVPDEYALFERTVTTTTVEASVDECFSVGSDIGKYFEWVAEIESSEVRDIDEQGRVLSAEFNAEAMGRSSHYVLQYDYSEAPNKLSWSQVEGDLTRRIFGSYEFASVDSEVNSLTAVTYRLFIELAFPLPGFVKRRAEQKIVESALQGFKERTEA